MLRWACRMEILTLSRRVGRFDYEACEAAP
jgi:hypothetical protein